MTKIYKYFVAFQAFSRDGHTYIGNSQIEWNVEIKDYDEIDKIQDYLKERDNFSKCVIINFVLLQS